MKRYKIILKRHGPWISPPTADTWFGHFCWAYKYLLGENELVNLLNAFMNGTLPWKISDAFPKDFLPMPVLPLNNVDFGDQTKDFKKQQFIHEDVLKSMSVFSYNNLWNMCELKNNISSKNQEREINFGFAPKDYDYRKSVKVDFAHNTINRFSESTMDEGGFFHTVVDWAPEMSGLQIFVDIEDSHFDNFKKAFEYIENSGFGKDKSTGSGSFSIDSWNEIDIPEDLGNSYLALSTFVPSEKDSTAAYYNTVVKYGKLGGDWAMPFSEVKHPYKKPLIMFKAGAVFREKPVGTMIKNIHSDDRIVQYALAFPYPINLNEENIP